MKKQNQLLFLAILFFTLIINGCKNDAPNPINEEELITTLRLTFTPANGGPPTAILQYRDIDGDGGNVAVITADPLNDSTLYNVAIEVLDESGTPADSITAEIEAEGDVHQFFFQTATGLNLTFNYADTDSEGHPVGLLSAAQAGAASSGTLTVTLRHEPNKHGAGVEDGDITNAGGETDIEVTFSLVIEP